MKRYLLFIAVCLIITSRAFAQTPEKLHALFQTEELNYEDAAVFVLEAVDIYDGSLPQDGFKAAAEKNWLPKKAQGGDMARLDGVSLLIMKAFNFKGGVLYSVFQSPHYAYRELQYKKIIEGRTTGAMAVSGELLFFMVGRTLQQLEERNQQ